MRRFLRACVHAANVWMLFWSGLCGTVWAEGKPTVRVDSGQTLFERVWEPKPIGKTGGDGLGPLFNERSCKACHFLGGVGGAGPNKNNVRFISVVRPIFSRIPERDRAALVKLHPAFTDATSIVLHRFSTSPVDYQRFCDNLIGIDLTDADDPVRQAGLMRVVAYREGQGTVQTLDVAGATLQLSERNTPPLFGAGLIASIPKAAIEKVAALQAKENPHVHGRFVGRFGWRGQTMTLGDFVRGACANELGMQVRAHQQARDPSAKQGRLPAKDLDLSDRECEEMTKFVAHLPAPRRLKPSDQAEAARLRKGEHAFQSIGCAVCHRPRLGDVKGIYSDLLLHDMGETLADLSPAPAPSSSELARSETPIVKPAWVAPTVSQVGWNAPATPRSPWGASSFSCGCRTQTIAEESFQQYWKTPPLWGLRDSGPYLHDGRAETVAEAIAGHGGEASHAVRKYLALSSREREQLLAFLDTLAAPDAASLPRPSEHLPALAAFTAANAPD
jgi:CxxC motif-containing protein (DUF1111 family)